MTTASTSSTASTPPSGDDVAALVESLSFTADGLVPAIAQQHDTGEVLMMAWMDAESCLLYTSDAADE